VIALAAAAVFLGASLQSATGFGFALVAAPIMFAVFGPHGAVTAGVLLGIEIGLLTLATEGRVPRVLRGEALGLVAWSLPGLALGALALRELSEALLSALVALGVLSALVLRLRGRRPRSTRARPRARARPWSAALAGVSSGALSTSTALSGPPIVLHLLARGTTPAEMRDSLAAVFVALAVLSVPALGIAGAFEVPSAMPILLAAALAGQLLGRRVFALLAAERYEKVMLAMLAGAALSALGASVV